MKTILQTENLTKSFGQLMAVNRVDIEFREGELTSIIGPNGAGKTTFFNLISGKSRANAGKIRFRGDDITGLAPHQIVKKGIGRIFQITNLFPELSVYQNIRVSVLARMGESSRLFSLDRKLRHVNEETSRILELIGLSDRRDVTCSALSHGDQRLVETGVALALEPRLLLLDEPTGGMGPEETDEMVKFVRRLSEKQRITIILVEHDMRVVFSISDRIVVMHSGSVIADGKPDEIKEDERVKAAYLGS
ncbi:MAG: ATP-binding cassette domain-containing protein [Proteobacteria bacterium]|nr:ATP-binding cassette domain-containing protein [Pseudomonadota bacterium]